MIEGQTDTVQHTLLLRSAAEEQISILGAYVSQMYGLSDYTFSKH